MTSNARSSGSNVSLRESPDFNRDMREAYDAWLDFVARYTPHEVLLPGSPERAELLTPFINEFMQARGWVLKEGSTFLFEVRT